MDPTTEFETRFKGRFFGKWRGTVTNVDDPTKRGRVKLKIPAVLGTTVESHWAWPVPAYGGGNGTGFFAMPEVGDLVWVEFEEGDKNRPIWQHGPWGKANGDEKLAGHVQGDADDADLGLHGQGTVPPSQFAGEYPHVRQLRDPADNRLEMDATEGAERVLLKHSSGSMYEVTPDGTITLASAGNINMYAFGNLSIQQAGGLTVESRNRTDYSYGDRYVETSGVEDHIVLDGCYWEVREHTMTSGGDQTQEGGGSLYVAFGGNRSVNFAGADSQYYGKQSVLQVMESAEWMVSNSLNTTPTAISWLMHAYNGSFMAKGTDPTGLATGGVLELGQLGSAIMYGGVPSDYGLYTAGSRVELDALQALVDSPVMVVNSAPLVMLGSSTAVQPMVLGTTWASLFAALITWLDTHVHTGNMGAPTTPPLVPSSSTLSSQITGCLSTTVFGE